MDCCHPQITMNIHIKIHLKKTNNQTTPSFAISWINGDIRNKMIWNGRLLSDCCCCLHVPDSPLLMRLTMIVSDKNISEFRALSCAQGFEKIYSCFCQRRIVVFKPTTRIVLQNNPTFAKILGCWWALAANGRDKEEQNTKKTAHF